MSFNLEAYNLKKQKTTEKEKKRERRGEKEAWKQRDPTIGQRCKKILINAFNCREMLEVL